MEHNLWHFCLYQAQMIRQHNHPPNLSWYIWRLTSSTSGQQTKYEVKSNTKSFGKMNSTWITPLLNVKFPRPSLSARSIILIEDFKKNIIWRHALRQQFKMNICWNLQSSFCKNTYNLGACYHFETVQVHNNSLYELLSHLKTPKSFCNKQLLHEYKTKNIQVEKVVKRPKRITMHRREEASSLKVWVTNRVWIGRLRKNDLELRADDL